jgi:signal transduction histidine kinase
MVRNSINRIKDIANNLLINSKNTTQIIAEKIDNINCNPESLYLALDNIIAEKRFEHHHSGINIQLVVAENAYHCFTNMNLYNFKRTISNLLNISVEATKNGDVKIKLDCDHHQAFIFVEDNGQGIPQDILQKVGEPGFSFNKKNGNGYGLYYAKEYFKSINGQLNISSIVNVGTKISITLPLSSIPEWFCENISINNKIKIIIVDDDPSIAYCLNR